MKLWLQVVVSLLTTVFLSLVIVIGYSYNARAIADTVSQRLEETNRNQAKFEKLIQDRMEETFRRMEGNQKEIRDDVKSTRDTVQDIKVQLAKGGRP